MILPLLVAACHQPEYVAPTANRQGLTSISAIIPDGIYAEQELGRLTVTDPEAERFEIPIPYFYPESSMLKMRVKAELQPNWKITPRLGVVDLTEDNEYTLTDPSGNSRKIVIAGTRAKSSNCQLLSIMVDEVKTSGVIYEDEGKILIPYLNDLSSVHISGQVAPHAKITEVNGKAYSAKAAYDMNTGATVTVTAHNGTTTKTYNVAQGIPTLMGQGLRTESVAPLCNVDPVTMVGLPAYNDKCYVSLAGIDTQILVGLGEGRAPFIVDAFTGSKKGEMVLGSAVADCITNDDAGHVLLCDSAPVMVDFTVPDSGNTVKILESQTVNIWTTNSADAAPTLFHTFANPLGFPIGHRMKVIGDITGDAVIVFTAEGITGYSTASQACYLTIKDGVVSSEIGTVDFASHGLGWGAAPVNFATVVPASVNPAKDGWFLDYYEGNVDPSVAHGSADCYILHYIDGNSKDNWVELMGNWAINPNCLTKTFNNGRFLALFGVSHFPEWSIQPRLHFFEITEPTAATPLLKNDAITIFQKGATDPDVGAAGDVVLVPSKDGYRLYVYYYDHHAQAIGAYVADCFEI